MLRVTIGIMSDTRLTCHREDRTLNTSLNVSRGKHLGFTIFNTVYLVFFFILSMNMKFYRNAKIMKYLNVFLMDSLDILQL